MNYYCLIAGLPDVEPDDSKLAFSIADFKEEVRPQLSADDVRLLELFYTKFDNQNLLRYLKDKEAKFDERGNITKEELEEGLKLIVEEDNHRNKNIPPYKDAQQVEVEPAKLENRLTELYYKWAMQCGNKVITRWFEFNLNLNNILSAYAFESARFRTDGNCRRT